MQQQPRFLDTNQEGNHRPFWHISRFFSLGCTMLVVLSLISACGSTGGSSSGSSSSSSSNGGKVTITEMDYWSVPAQGATLNKLFTQYQKLHPNVTIQRTPVPFDSLLPKADQEAASHTLPNILVLDNPDVAQFASTGALTSLDSYMQGKFSDSDFYAGPLTTMKYQNKTYSIPVGNNDLALFYNKKMLDAAHIQPPKTWSDLTAAAKALTHGNTYGFAFSAPANEQATFQLEAFLWSNKGELSKVNASESVSSLQLLADMVHKGYASRGTLNWGQPDVATQFGEKNAAIMLNGPWEIPALDQQYHMKIGVDYDVIPMAVPQSGMQPVVPLGGEAWTIPLSKDSAAMQASWDLVNWLEQPDQLRQLDEGFNYIPAIKSTAQLVLKDLPALQVFADELNTARARTADLGAKYPKVSQKVWTAEQAALTGSQTPQAALDQAQKEIDPIVNGGS